MAPRRPKNLSVEDQKLWEQFIRTAEPLHVRQAAFSLDPAAKTPAAKLPRGPIPYPETRIYKPVLSGKEPLVRYDLALDPMQPLSRISKHLDKRTHDRLRKGKSAPEARIDLHGMTAAQAHAALRGFIRSSHGRGLRLVLVITGKGNTTRDEIGIMPTRSGVLRHALPQWLGVPDMHPMILQISAAHIRHGGSGAYYVYLKRKGRS